MKKKKKIISAHKKAGYQKWKTTETMNFENFKWNLEFET